MKTFPKSVIRRIVLIDDDPEFCKIMANFAESRGINLDFFNSLIEMGSLGQLSTYDVAIIDFDLGAINGVEIAEYLPIFFGEMPMILISGRQRTAQAERSWPGSIKQFVHKDRGPDAILDAAVALLRRDWKRPSGVKRLANSNCQRGGEA